MPSPIQTMEILDDAMADILRQKTPAERLAIANGIWKFAREMVFKIVDREHPDWTEPEIQKEVARRISQPGFEEEWYKKVPLSLFV